MNQNQDGSYGEIQKLSEIGEQFKRVIVGEEKELQELKDEAIQLRLDNMDKKLNRLLIHFGLAKEEVLVI